MTLVLASTSRIRQLLLRNAGVAFEAAAPDVDETAVKERNRGIAPDRLAAILAEAKAVSVSNRFRDRIVVGCDQVLNAAGEPWDKPADMAVARTQLQRLRGSEHRLETAVACARNGEILWRYLARPALRMRAFSDGFLEHYLEHVGSDVTASVGGYKLEGLGVQLFAAIEGDYFAILGLPLLPLLDFLRGEGVLPE